MTNAVNQAKTGTDEGDERANPAAASPGSLYNPIMGAVASGDSCRDPSTLATCRDQYRHDDERLSHPTLLSPTTRMSVGTTPGCLPRLAGQPITAVAPGGESLRAPPSPGQVAVPARR